MSTKDARAAALARLLDEPPPTFVATRKALAAELKAGGDAAGAKAVLARRRPTWTSWALSRVARADAAILKKVLAAHDALAGAVKAGEKIAAAQTAFSRALEAAGKTARGEMEEAGHGGAAAEARKLRATLRRLAEQGEPALAAAAAGDLAKLEDAASDADDRADAHDSDADDGFLAAAKATLAAAHAARTEKARRQAAGAREKERRAKAAELARAEKDAAQAAERVEALETEIAEAIGARRQAEARVKELRALLRET